MKWGTVVIYVDIDTGELLQLPKQEIKEKYKILRKQVTTKYINTEYGRKWITHECIRREEQLKLKL